MNTIWMFQGLIRRARKDEIQHNINRARGKEGGGGGGGEKRRGRRREETGGEKLMRGRGVAALLTRY